MQRDIDISDENYRYVQAFFSKYDGVSRLVPYGCIKTIRDIDRGGYMRFAQTGMKNRIDINIVAKVLSRYNFRNGYTIKIPKRTITPEGRR